jgi:response regulator RpfG family c-di-GMP phosphodiesterase
MNDTGPRADPETASRVLLVDDEPNVLTALRRALRGRGFDVSCAGSGAEALALLQREPVDAIVSDMRMPGMSGAEFLKASIALAPDAVRVLLTGYSDMESTTKAINEGEIFRYVTKPWDDALLLQGLNDGLARKALERERDALRAIAEQRAEQLRVLNVGLEEQVAQRTRELAAALEEQRDLAERLKTDFSSTVRLLSSLIEQRAGLTAGCPRRVARHVRTLGPQFGLSPEALYDLSFAALLQDLGRLTLPDELVRQPLEALEAKDRWRVLRHPLAGESSLMALPSLKGAGAILAHVNENYDGSGAPGKCSGQDIPLTARLLRVVADYEHLLAGAIDIQRLTPEQAFRRLRQHRGVRYDPAIVDGFLRAMDQPVVGKAHKVLMASDGLRPGMVLAQDLVSKAGSLLLSQGHQLTEGLIAHIRRLEDFSGEFLWIAVTQDEGREVRVGAT